MAVRTSEEWQGIIVDMQNKMNYLENMNIENALKNVDTRMSTIEVAMATLASANGNIGGNIEKNKFTKEVLESKAVNNISKLSTPGEYRMWSKKFKNAYEQVRLYARKTFHWLDNVKEKDVLQELEVGPANMTGAEAVLEQLSVEHMKDMKSGGTKFDGMKENMEELNRDLWSILLDKCEGEAWMKINSVRDGEGLWAYVKLHQWFTKTTLQGQTTNRLRIMQPIGQSTTMRSQARSRGGKSDIVCSPRKMEKTNFLRSTKCLR